MIESSLRKEIIVNDENMEVTEVESAAGDFVMRIFPRHNLKILFTDPKDEVELRGGITSAFSSHDGRRKAAAIRNGRYTVKQV